jgi:alkylated DNA repair dioxygenase AlkB
VRIALTSGAWLTYDPGWLSSGEADALACALRETLPWEQRRIVLFGRAILQPRLIAWAGERPYRYSGQTLPARPFDPALAEVRARVEAHTGARFNHVLVNRYRDGGDRMGYHADDEPELGRDPVLASVSLGATRRFMIAGRKSPRLRRALPLEHGSLLVMGGTFQHELRHAVPRERAPVGERINLTFRLIGAA